MSIAGVRHRSRVRIPCPNPDPSPNLHQVRIRARLPLRSRGEPGLCGAAPTTRGDPNPNPNPNPNQVNQDYAGLHLLLEETHTAFAPSGRVITMAFYPDGRQERLLTLTLP
eukprot:scaffold41899_cov36-Phaeocystis_antarctica.AAC.2